MRKISKHRGVRLLAMAMGALVAATAVHADGSILVSGSLTREHDVRPGGSYSGSIEVQNPSDAPAEIRVYKTDYSFRADGRVMYGEPGQAPRSNAAWLRFSPEQTRIMPGKSVNVTYSLSVPDDGSLSGTYWSILMVEPVVDGGSQPSPSSSGQSSLGVQQVLRYGIQLISTVGSTGLKQVRFLQLKVATQEGTRHLVVDLENNGERVLRPALYAEIYDAAGTHLGRFEAGVRRLYPGTSGRFDAPLQGLVRATYKALVVADCGGDDVYGISITLVVR